MAGEQPTITDRIKADHQQIMERIAELERRAGKPHRDVLVPMFGLMRADLHAHIVTEEEFVYELLEVEMRGWIENSRREHQTIRDHLAALAADGIAPAAWTDRLRAMRQALEAHIAAEDRAVLPHLEMMYDLERLRDLGDDLARRKQEAR